jgi:hypothetical protein
MPSLDDDDFWDMVTPPVTKASHGIWPAHSFGPIFTATYETECESCDEGIQPGEDARADGHGGWIHADTMCEKVARDG